MSSPIRNARGNLSSLWSGWTYSEGLSSPPTSWFGYLPGFSVEKQVCYICGGVGHIAAVCTSKRPVFRSLYGKPDRVGRERRSIILPSYSHHLRPQSMFLFYDMLQKPHLLQVWKNWPSRKGLSFQVQMDKHSYLQKRSSGESFLR